MNDQEWARPGGAVDSVGIVRAPFGVRVRLAVLLLRRLALDIIEAGFFDASRGNALVVGDVQRSLVASLCRHSGAGR